MRSPRLPALLGLLLLGACALGPVEIRHGPVAGLSPAAVADAPPLRVEVRETAPVDRIRLQTVIDGAPVDRRSGFVFTNDLAAEFGAALSTALRQRGLPVDAPGAAPSGPTRLTLDVAIETADGRLEAVRRGAGGVTTLPIGPGAIMTVPTTTWQQTLDMGVGAQGVLRGAAGQILLDRRYEHRTAAPLTAMPGVENQAKAALEESLRVVVRRIAEDPDLIRAIAAAR
jgi:hypothetical protein